MDTSAASQTYALVLASLLVIFALKGGLELTWRATFITFLTIALATLAAMVVFILVLHRL